MKTLMYITRARTPLEKHVQLWINVNALEYENGVRGVLKDLFYGKYASGMVGHSMYYDDKLKFFAIHRREIFKILHEYISNGFLNSPAALTGWDKSDPLAQEAQNRSLLAWFGFEETARNLADRNNIEI